MPRTRLAATIGLHGSASTWVFNVVRELMQAAWGAGSVTSLYADQPGDLPAQFAGSANAFVVKSHHGSVELDDWLTAHNAIFILSMRDPRDAALSMSQRFATPLATATAWIVNDCNRLLRLLRTPRPLLRYESRFFDQPGAVGALAKLLGIELPPAALQDIFARYQTANVEGFARNLPNLPPERLTKVGGFLMDKTTQILGPHIGDGETGKFRALPEAEQVRLTQIFGPFLEALKYEK